MIPVGPIVAALMTLSHLSQPHALEVAAPIAVTASTMEEAMLLVDTVDAEGGVIRPVMRCQKLGDHGHAFGGYQLHAQHFVHYTVAEFCRNPTLQTALALKALSHGVTVRTRIAAFMGRRENDAEVSRRVARYERLMKQVHELEEKQANG